MYVTIGITAAHYEERSHGKPGTLEEQREETRLIIEELLEDGSDPDALYTIEHHLSADDFETLEKVAVEAFKLGYEVTEARRAGSGRG